MLDQQLDVLGGEASARWKHPLDDRDDAVLEPMFAQRLGEAGFGTITTEIVEAPAFYFAEDYHQQYLAKNPGGYCGLGGTGVSCPAGVLQGV